MQQLQCVCGWKGKLFPDNTMFMGPGGQLSCPRCSNLKHNWNLEVYGVVKVVHMKSWSGFCKKLGTDITILDDENNTYTCKVQDICRYAGTVGCFIRFLSDTELENMGNPSNRYSRI